MVAYGLVDMAVRIDDQRIVHSLIRQVLPCALADGSVRPCPGVLDKLRTQLTRLDRRAEELAQARRTLRQAIAAAEHAE